MGDTPASSWVYDAYVTYELGRSAGLRDEGGGIFIGPDDGKALMIPVGGGMVVKVGACEIVAPAGSFVVVPRGVVHRPSNHGAEPARVLPTFPAGGMDRFFEEVAEGRMPLQAVPQDPAVLERLGTFTERYGYEFARLPPQQAQARA